MAQNQEDLLGSWSAYGDSKDVTSIYQAIKLEFKDSNILYASGCDFEGEDKSGFSSALNIAKKAEVIVVCLGEKKSWSGENASRSTIELPKIQEDLLSELYKLNKPVIVLLSNGRPLDLRSVEVNSDAILEMWQPGIVGGKPAAVV